MTERKRWRCFFCDEVFDTPGAACDHFGAQPFSDAACRIKLGHERGLLNKIRELEEELARYRVEDSDTARQYHALVAESITKERVAEERGYANALRDIEAGRAETSYATRILAAMQRQLA